MIIHFCRVRVKLVLWEITGVMGEIGYPRPKAGENEILGCCWVALPPCNTPNPDFEKAVNWNWG